MAKFTYNGNSVSNAGADDMSVDEFLDSDICDSIMSAFDVPSGSELQMKDGSQWITPDGDYTISSSDHYRFTTVGGTKG